jgi:hypothetical protein
MRSNPRKPGLTVIVVVTDNQFLEFTIFAHFAPYVLVESIEVVLQLAGVHLVLGIVGRVLVHVGHEDGLRVGGLHVFARASVAVTACADLVVEGAVNLVLLGTENGGEVVGHDGLLWRLSVAGVRVVCKDREMEEVRTGEATEGTGARNCEGADDCLVISDA